MGETPHLMESPLPGMPAADDRPVTVGFKWLLGFDKDGRQTTDPKKLAKIVSYNDRSCEWVVGEWKVVKGAIVPCRNGFHMSATPKQALSFVSGNILALVEARGESAPHTNKSVHAEMRIVKWWSEDSYQNNLSYSSQIIDVPADVQAQADKLTNDGYTARNRLQSEAEKAMRAITNPADTKFQAACRPARRTRDLEDQLAGIRYETDQTVASNEQYAAEQIARAEYNAAVQAARARRDDRVAASSAAFDDATKEFRDQRDATRKPAEAAYEAACRAANDEYTAVKEAASKLLADARAEVAAGLAARITTELGKPVAGS